MAKREKTPTYQRVVYALVVSNGVSLLLSTLRAVESGSSRYSFMIWNLFLAWLPLLFAWWLVQRLKRTPWLSWQNITLSLLWLAFLPNSFYLVSDIIHLHETGEVSLLYDVVMFSSYIFNAFTAGFMSLFLVHRELLKRVAYPRSHMIISAILLACSYAIYLGRTLRWNSWDILVNPEGILFDVSEGVVNPGSHPQLFVTTFVFFLLLLSIYLVVWELVRALRADNR